MLHTFTRLIARVTPLRLRRWRTPGLFRPRVAIEHVDDPDTPMRLIRAVGPLGPGSIDRLLGSWAHLTAPHAVHVDLADAWITDVRTMRRLEAEFDHLERRHIEVRVVGIDPQHPALAV
jgi:hypothetical protein